MSRAEIKLTDGSIVTAQAHAQMLCDQYGLAPGANISRDPQNPARWVERTSAGVYLSADDAADIAKLLAELERGD